MNNAPIEAPVTAPYTIINIDGGMIIPIAPELINKPIGNARPYPWATIAGNIVLPTAITVAGLDPEMAEKNIALVTVVTPKPPVTGRINALAKSINRRDMPPRAIRFPANMKNGMAINGNLSIPEKNR